jgi:hypothetical protein
LRIPQEFNHSQLIAQLDKEGNDMTTLNPNLAPGAHRCELNLIEKFGVSIRVDVDIDKHGNPKVRLHNGSCSHPTYIVSGYEFGRIKRSIEYMCYAIYGQDHNIDPELITTMTEYLQNYTIKKARQSEIARISKGTT